MENDLSPQHHPYAARLIYRLGLGQVWRPPLSPLGERSKTLKGLSLHLVHYRTSTDTRISTSTRNVFVTYGHKSIYSNHSCWHINCSPLTRIPRPLGWASRPARPNPDQQKLSLGYDNGFNHAIAAPSEDGCISDASLTLFQIDRSSTDAPLRTADHGMWWHRKRRERPGNGERWPWKADRLWFKWHFGDQPDPNDLHLFSHSRRNQPGTYGEHLQFRKRTIGLEREHHCNMAHTLPPLRHLIR